MGSLVHWFTGSWVHWFTGSLVHWFIGSLVDGFTGSLVDGFTGSLVHWFTGSLVDGFTGSLVGCKCVKERGSQAFTRLHIYTVALYIITQNVGLVFLTYTGRGNTVS